MPGLTDWPLVSDTRNELCLVDAHVHLHPMFDRVEFFEQTRLNFESFASRTNEIQRLTAVAMLTDMSGVDAFHELRSSDVAGRWQRHPTQEATSVRFVHEQGTELIWIAGHQAVTNEGLEVLALGTRERIADGLPIADTVVAMAATDAIVVVPWGVGKWLGRRRAVVDRLIQDRQRFPNLCFGDNHNRPSFWGYPNLLRKAAACARHVLPGSDPLPIREGAREAGRIGFIGPSKMDPDRPFSHLKHWLFSRTEKPEPYGRPQSSLRAIRQQLLLRAK